MKVHYTGDDVTQIIHAAMEDFAKADPEVIRVWVGAEDQLVHIKLRDGRVFALEAWRVSQF